MGACSFVETTTGGSASQAFDRLRGGGSPGGYTGTIAEKSSYRTFQVPSDVTTPEQAVAYANRCLDSMYEQDETADVKRIGEITDDKWGPAGHFQVGETHVFFGYASS